MNAITTSAIESIANGIERIARDAVIDTLQELNVAALNIRVEDLNTTSNGLVERVEAIDTALARHAEKLADLESEVPLAISREFEQMSDVIRDNVVSALKPDINEHIESTVESALEEFKDDIGETVMENDDFRDSVLDLVKDHRSDLGILTDDDLSDAVCDLERQIERAGEGCVSQDDFDVLATRVEELENGDNVDETLSTQLAEVNVQIAKLMELNELLTKRVVALEEDRNVLADALAGARAALLSYTVRG